MTRVPAPARPFIAPPQGPQATSRRSLIGRFSAKLALGALACLLIAYVYSRQQFPSDQTPRGAYLRVAKAVNQGEPADLFPYTEEAAQHACFTIGSYRKELLDVARAHYPRAEYMKLEAEYRPLVEAKNGDGVFALIVSEQGWLDQLRRDVSGIARIQEEGPRATIETVKGTRYSLRRRPNGIWGLTAFTPTLVEEAQRAERDLSQVKAAALDFDRAKASNH